MALCTNSVTATAEDGEQYIRPGSDSHRESNVTSKIICQYILHFYGLKLSNLLRNFFTLYLSFRKTRAYKVLI